LRNGLKIRLSNIKMPLAFTNSNGCMLLYYFFWGVSSELIEFIKFYFFIQ